MAVNEGAGFKIKHAINSNSFVFYIAKDLKEYLFIESQLDFFCSNIKIIKFPPWDVEPYSRSSPSLAVTGQRIKALLDLYGSDSNEKRLLITTVDALIQKTPPIEHLIDGVLNFRVGQSYDRQKVILSLIIFGYRRTSVAESVGDFAVRGGVIDIVGYDHIGYRIDFFGKIVDSIKAFNIDTQLTLHKKEEVAFYPISEIILDEESINCFKGNYLHLFGITDDQLYNNAVNGVKYIGAEHWLPLFYKNLDSIFINIPKDALIMKNDQFELDLNNQCLLINQNYEARIKANDKSYNALKPSLLYQDREYILMLLNNFKIYNNDEILVEYPPDLYLASKINNEETIETLLNYKKASNKNICIFCNSEGSLNRFQKILDEEDIKSRQIYCYEEISKENSDINLAILGFEIGFDTDKITFFTEKIILGKKIKNQKSRKRKNIAAKFFQNLIAIEIGSLLVHAEYGIGRFQGLTTISIKEVPHDFIEILYADDDKLYLPVENLEVISRYGDENQQVALDKLGGVSWQSRKAKLKERIKIAAEALIRTAAKRSTVSAIILEAIETSYQKFCDKFPYITTEDQEDAINDTIEDLRSGQPMDRLICADVGFGKTEVALRASAVATLNHEPVQVAVIVPTTLLARQHYETFLSRFKDFSVSIKQLSKFTQRSQIKEIKEDLKNGKVDIVIGTHALLADGIDFKNLGLLIVDEEQHFGVAQKEKLKNLKNNVHVLTLSATPIPRTLQMSLVNIKSLSIIATAPINRKPVKTFILPYDSFTIREALLKEKARNGLSFYVTPRISYFDELEQKLLKLVPELKIAKAHGSLSSGKLDQVMNDFYDHKFDVLLSTSIVESGLDITNANTIIIDRPNMFGLAQLYQMRGRVGRSDIPAYAYFLVSKTSSLTPVARNRLEILQSLQTLGSGFNIASHDMDNRGYGNLLGDEQSGHIKEVGIELYQKMLELSIEEMQGAELSSELSKEWSPIINLGLSVQIPKDYIEDVALRFSLYRQIADIDNEEECDKFAAGMIDRFGKLPEEADHLFDVIKIKQLAKRANICKIELGDKGLAFSFRDNKANNQAKILETIAFEREFEAKMKIDGKLLFLFRSQTIVYDKIASVKRILSKLCEPF